MKSVLIVVVMLVNSAVQDLYIIQEPRFETTRECAQFVMFYNELILLKAQSEYPDREIADIMCIPEEQLDQLYKQVKI